MFIRDASNAHDSIFMNRSNMRVLIQGQNSARARNNPPTPMAKQWPSWPVWTGNSHLTTLLPPLPPLPQQNLMLMVRIRDT